MSRKIVESILETMRSSWSKVKSNAKAVFYQVFFELIDHQIITPQNNPSCLPLSFKWTELLDSRSFYQSLRQLVLIFISYFYLLIHQHGKILWSLQFISQSSLRFMLWSSWSFYYHCSQLCDNNYKDWQVKLSLESNIIFACLELFTSNLRIIFSTY